MDRLDQLQETHANNSCQHLLREKENKAKEIRDQDKADASREQEEVERQTVRIFRKARRCCRRKHEVADRQYALTLQEIRNEAILLLTGFSVETDIAYHTVTKPRELGNISEDCHIRELDNGSDTSTTVDLRELAESETDDRQKLRSTCNACDKRHRWDECR
jgi:hypothetical protein